MTTSERYQLKLARWKNREKMGTKTGTVGHIEDGETAENPLNIGVAGGVRTLGHWNHNPVQPRLDALKPNEYGPFLSSDSCEIAPQPGATGTVTGTVKGKWRQIASMADIGDFPTCYVLCGGGKAYYIGQTVNFEKRIRRHGWRLFPTGVGTPRGFIEGAVLKVKDCRRQYGDWLMTEARLIRRLNPLWNIKKPSGMPRTKRDRFDRLAVLEPGEIVHSFPTLCESLKLTEGDLLAEFSREIVWAIPESAVNRRRTRNVMDEMMTDRDPQRSAEIHQLLDALRLARSGFNIGPLE